jgi:hypothetical protein
VAEEVVPIENRLVDYDANGQVMGLNYAQFAPLFAGAIADLNKKLTDVDPTHDGSLASLVATYLENAFVKIGNLTVGSSAKPAGITLYDTSTKQPYCLTITNGVPVSTQGECPVVSVDTPATSSSTTLPTSQTPSPDSSSSASLGSSAGDSTTPLTPSDSTAVPTDTTTPAS